MKLSTPEPMTQDEKNKIAKTITERGALLPCPRCGKNQFTLADGYVNTPLQNALNEFIIGGPSIPSVAVICTNCGYISNHAIGVLGLMPANPQEAKP
ncbi:MAG: hypothetical protein ORN24_03750 [Burkholderiales bacterium]|jgi:predicted RNA-binding Zn-ribbon protein involved in translation (DUF1610 family)|nr:hypothetical protein [Burkholderiales bacterium]